MIQPSTSVPSLALKAKRLGEVRFRRERRVVLNFVRRFSGRLSVKVSTMRNRISHQRLIRHMPVACFAIQAWCVRIFSTVQVS